jgi:outer membrane protein
MKSLSKILLATTIIVCCAHAHSARADSDFATGPEGVNYVGLGVGMLPDYSGSDEYQAAPLPFFRYEFGKHRNIELMGNYLSANLINDEVIRFGPALRYRLGRDSDVEDEVVALMPEIDDALEVGATLSGKWILNNDPRNRFIIGVDGLFDTSGASDGFNGSVYSRYWAPVSKNIDLGIAGAVRFGDDDFMETYYGVSAAGSAASGLPTFSAGSGVSSFDIGPMAMYHVNKSWHVAASLRYSILTGDAADSPVVDTRGDSNQFLGLVGLIYTW